MPASLNLLKSLPDRYTAGSYRIQFPTLKRQFVGISRNLHAEVFGHLCHLRENSHPSILLQQFWILYGEQEAFLVFDAEVKPAREMREQLHELILELREQTPEWVTLSIYGDEIK